MRPRCASSGSAANPKASVCGLALGEFVRPSRVLVRQMQSLDVRLGSRRVRTPNSHPSTTNAKPRCAAWLSASSWVQSRVVMRRIQSLDVRLGSRRVYAPKSRLSTANAKTGVAAWRSAISAAVYTRPAGANKVVCSPTMQCPSCSSPGTALLTTWWGGRVGPKMFQHTQCDACGMTYNGKTGRSNNTAIAIYGAAVLLVIIGVAALAFWLSRSMNR